MRDVVQHTPRKQGAHIVGPYGTDLYVIKNDPIHSPALLARFHSSFRSSKLAISAATRMVMVWVGGAGVRVGRAVR